MYNFVCRLILSQNVLYIAHGLPEEIIPFPVQLPLKLLERNLYGITNPSKIDFELKFFRR